ncbi:cupin [Phlyctema vagabunda]|uniref:Cupin n=1 Tax=Phlyctema vagabunda TaxID=108571 RepID=A0ABR4PWI5_9HELO
MAPANADGRRKTQREGQKTGITLPDTGVRDEHGLEPIDNLFSSPEKSAAKSMRSTKGMDRVAINGNTTISSSEEMDVNDSSVPDPADVLTERKRANLKMPLPRSRSPHKTYLQSPARRNASLGPHSPVRSVIRKLDFSVNESDDSPYDRSAQNGHRGKRALSQPLSSTRLAPPDEDADLDETAQSDIGVTVNGEDSMQQVEYANDDVEEPDDEPDEEAEEEPEVESEPEPASEKEPEPESEDKAPVKAGRKRKVPPTTTAAVAHNDAKRPRGRPAKPKPVIEDVEEIAKDSIEEPVEEPVEEPSEEIEEPEEGADGEGVEEQDKPRKRRRSGKKSEESASAAVSKKTSARGRPSKKSASKVESEKPKKRSRKPRADATTEVDSPQVTRGPPLPKNSQGLFILRREVPNSGAGFQQTRSGRNSFKPLAYWRGEQVQWEQTNEAEVKDGNGNILLPTIKQVVRTEEVAQPKTSRGHRKATSKKSKKRAVEPESEDDELEPWEEDPGRITGDVREWDPLDPLGQQANDKEEELALSAAAIVTREIAGAQFKFAKTLTLPFFGSGMVDLPPGAVKKPKNSRKMQMAFFVHYGRVQVSVNDNVFRIGKGGMWQVPRGNFYSITNDYDKPARIFFSQGNEVVDDAGES